MSNTNDINTLASRKGAFWSLPWFHLFIVSFYDNSIFFKSIWFQVLDATDWVFGWVLVVPTVLHITWDFPHLQCPHYCLWCAWTLPTQSAMLLPPVCYLIINSRPSYLIFDKWKTSDDSKCFLLHSWIKTWRTILFLVTDLKCLQLTGIKIIKSNVPYFHPGRKSNLSTSVKFQMQERHRNIWILCLPQSIEIIKLQKIRPDLIIVPPFCPYISYFSFILVYNPCITVPQKKSLWKDGLQRYCLRQLGHGREA